MHLQFYWESHIDSDDEHGDIVSLHMTFFRPPMHVDFRRQGVLNERVDDDCNLLVIMTLFLGIMFLPCYLSLMVLY